MTKKHRRAYRPALLVALALMLSVPGLAVNDADQPSRPQVFQGADGVETVTPFVVDVDLRTLPIAPAWRPGDPIKEVPRRFFGTEQLPADDATPRPASQGPDPLMRLQTDAVGALDPGAFSSRQQRFPGQGFTGVVPPDPAGDVGPDYYIQMVNDSGGATFAIYDKNTEALVAGPTFLDSLGSSFCASGAGDPIVLYDHLAGRWLLSEFSSSGNRLCIYVSQTGDPISGGWYAYDLQAPNFPDYPKYAVWPDAYYVTSNEAGGSPVYALERSQMLIGGAASAQRFEAPDMAGFGFQALTPADLDGSTSPPAGSPAYFIRHRDDERHNAGSNDPGQDFLEIWEVSVDFANSANSSLTGPTNIAIGEFDSGLCGFTSFSCFPQPSSGSLLDPVREVVMWRLQYRNFGTHGSLIGNLVTDVNGSDRGGIRWFELRNGGGGWSLFQEGTYSPDATNRWMGSIAMDGAGNVALGYNVSSSSVQPGIRYTGRLAADPAGSMPQGETTLVAGTSSINTNRFGDYNSMKLDASDDCTFWFTAEYTAGGVWQTDIASIGFAGCGGTCGNGTAEAGEVCDGTDLNGETCVSQGCTGGTLACTGDCGSFDLSACTGCPVCDNDGTCEAGEDCNSCSNDCPSGTTSGAVCGNGICETANGESCLNCPGDCNGKQNGNPNNRFCCGDGATGQGAVSCGDSRCTTGGFQCNPDPVSGGSFCCGDLTCDSGEDCGNCGLDCSLGAEICTGGVDEDCDGFVDCADSDCATDPACTCNPVPEVCDNGVDDDCDDDVDCNDADCTGDPACPSCSLGQPGESCSSNADCCSNKCKGPPSNRTCR